MSKRKMKLSIEERIRIVENYLNGQSSLSEAAQEAGVTGSTIKSWTSIYENEGPTGLLPAKKNRHYSKELKVEAVLDYLDGSETLAGVAKKYGLRNKKQLQDWIKIYNTHGNFKSESGGSKVSQSKNFSLDERVISAKQNYTLGHDYYHLRPRMLPLVAKDSTTLSFITRPLV